MLELVLLLGAGCALAMGAAAAQIGGPVSWSWGPRLCSIAYRIQWLARRAPSLRRRRSGRVVLAVVMAGSALATYASQPSAPARLARQVVALIADDRPSRPGNDAIVDTIKADDAGQADDAPLDPTIWTDEALLARARARGVWDGVKLYNGMTAEQTRRFYILNEKFEVRLSEYATPYLEAALLAGQPRPRVLIGPDDVVAALDPKDGQEYRNLVNQGRQVTRDRQQAVFDQYGPVQVRATQAEVLAFNGQAIGSSPLSAASGPLGQFGQNAFWKVLQRNPDGTVDEVLSAPNPPDPNYQRALMTDKPGPFAPRIEPVTEPFTRFTILGSGFGLTPMRPGQIAEATVTVNGRKFALPSNVSSATTVQVGDVTYPVERAPVAPAS